MAPVATSAAASGCTGTTAALSEWRDRALIGAEAAKKERERDSRDEEPLRLKAKLGEITVADALLLLIRLGQS